MNINKLGLACQLVALLLASMMIVSCGGDSDTSSSTNNGKTKQVFHYNQPNNITSLDPAFAKSQNNIWACDHLYNRLIELDDDLNVVPAIASKWTISEDGKTYTFTLREDIYFHDNEVFSAGKGRAVVAADVVYSFNRILDAKVSSPGSWIFKDRLRVDEPFVALDERTFELHLAVPFRPMLQILTMHYCSIVPKEAVEKYGTTFRANPVGTGPFQFKKWIENQTLILVKNERYFEKENGQQLPYVDGVRISFIGDRKTAYLELMNGKIDLISGLEASYTNELLTTEGALQSKHQDKLQFIKSPFLNTEYLGINMQFKKDKNPLQIKKVRQALNYAFNRELMLKSLRNNVGKAANSGFTPIGLPSHDAQKVKGYSYNPDKARQLLAEAGFPNGKGLPAVKLMTNKDYLDLGTFITREWEDIGIKAQIDVIESATLRNMMTKGQAPFFRGSWIADYPDAESYFTVFYGKNPAPPNYTQFQNATFDRLYEQALQENDDGKRFDLYQQMDKIIVEEAPVVFLMYDETAVCAQKNISGLSRNALNLLSLKKVKKN